MIEPEPLQQLNRTYVRFRGRKLSYFSGCDYFRLASHPKVVAALAHAAHRYGLNVAASRMTSGNHRLYGKLEAKLTLFFEAPTALLVGSGYMTNLVVAQTLAGHFSHALIDERAHPSLQDAARLLDCPVLPYKHQRAEDIASCAFRCGPGARLILLTDGLFAHDGSAAPLAQYLEVLPPDAVLLVDDAHGAGVLGSTGKGSLEHERVGRERVIQTITLSKAFGTYGGAILSSKSVRQRILDRSALFASSTPLPLPLVEASLASLVLLSTDRGLRARLNRNSELVKSRLRATYPAMRATPGPIVRLVPPDKKEALRLHRKLIRAGIFPPYLSYPSRASTPYFRFAFSSEHTGSQLNKLLQTLTKAGLAGWEVIG
ncbi:MAG TPA: pyridoxal phosphate-dependent aminotransferase family protein [Candidatus Limnocylindrales bacterium]|nr:pyridoxal phosphate-dependent aminotransferase family protein [Candidatus Limnocylindrales bacterium]